ncbi:YjcZ family sporulation protein [Desertibacillus haloalkaliphilus]|nr:YjcZ family sporulation protein [Desertibacillus haloalkaliphilus]MBU8907643.1 YjcZ family sporulation protein [Desertibacillus haloalkaliphilus]
MSDHKHRRDFNFALIVVLFILLIIVGTAYVTPYY